jgi:hypothetical protein
MIDSESPMARENREYREAQRARLRPQATEQARETPEPLTPVVAFLDKYGLANTSGERHAARKEALALARAALRAATTDPAEPGLGAEFDRAVLSGRLDGFDAGTVRRLRAALSDTTEGQS